MVDEYFRQVHEERQRRLKGKMVVAGNGGTVFPNMSFHSRQPQAIVVWHPLGPLLTEAWRFYLVDGDAPAEVKETLRHFYLRYSGPAGMTEQDDMENWNYASTASKGVIARLYPYNYQMGVGLERPAETIRGMVGGTSGAGEHNQRFFYKRWAEYMAAESWVELARTGRA